MATMAINNIINMTVKRRDWCTSQQGNDEFGIHLLWALSPKSLQRVALEAAVSKAVPSLRRSLLQKLKLKIDNLVGNKAALKA